MGFISRPSGSPCSESQSCGKSVCVPSPRALQAGCQRKACLKPALLKVMPSANSNSSIVNEYYKL